MTAISWAIVGVVAAFIGWRMATRVLCQWRGHIWIRTDDGWRCQLCGQENDWR